MGTPLGGGWSGLNMLLRQTEPNPNASTSRLRIASVSLIGRIEYRRPARGLYCLLDCVTASWRAVSIPLASWQIRASVDRLKVSYDNLLGCDGLNRGATCVKRPTGNRLR